MEATSSAADLVSPRLTWDAHKPATRPDVFTVDVFELVALRWLSGEEVPKEDQTPIFHETVEVARRYLPNLTLRSGCLYHNRTQSGQCVRDGVQEDVLFAAHSARMGGHYAVRGTLLKLNGIAWWPEIQVDVELLVCTCELCLHNKHARAPGREGALTSVTINKHVHLDDIITPQPLRGGEQVITQAVHSASK